MMKVALKECIFLLVAILLTAPVAAQRLAVLSDVHVAPGNANAKKLKEAVAEINVSDVDAVLLTGDLTNEGSDEQLYYVKSILDELSKPIYVIPGNHENTWSQSACKTFNGIWGSDRFVFTLGKLAIVGMNCGPFMKMGDGHIKREDLTWLDDTLSHIVKPGVKVLSVNHYPILDDLDNYLDYVKILKKYPVITHLCGHYHSWRLYETQGINGLIVRALDMGRGNYGYTLMNVDLEHNWIHVYNKPIGHDPVIQYAYKINLDYFTLVQRTVVRDRIPQNFEIKKVYADDASVFTRLGLDSGTIYFGNSLGYLKALDKETGCVRWQYKTTAMLFSRPAVGERYIVLPTADKRLVWLDKKSGEVRFTHYSKGPYVADGVLHQGVLYQGGYKTFQAWDVKRHKMLWHYDSIGNYCQASPAVDGNQVIFGAWDTHLRALNRHDGSLFWSWSNGISQNLFSPGNVVPVVTPDRVIIVAPDRVTTAIDRSTGKTIWREKNQYKVRESLGVSEDGKTAYAKTMDGELIAMSTQGDSYNLLWKVDLGLGYEHAPCLVLEHRGYIFTGSRHGVLTVVNATTRQVEFSGKLGSSEVNGFDIDDNGDIYCSLIEGTIFRISIH